MTGVLTFSYQEITHKAIWIREDIKGRQRLIPTINALAIAHQCRMVMAKGGMDFGFYLVGMIRDINIVLELMKSVYDGIKAGEETARNIMKSSPKHGHKILADYRGRINIIFKEKIRELTPDIPRFALYDRDVSRYIRETTLRANRKLNAK